MGKYRFAKIEDQTMWDIIVEKSPQYSVFSNSIYLKSLGRNYCLFFIYKGQQVKAALSLILSDDGERTELDELCIYNSILFFNNPEQKLTNSRKEQFDITQYIIEKLDSLYDSIEIGLSPEFEDIRPFLWYNYHSSNPLDKFILDLRYTSYIDISEFFLKKNDQDTLLFENMDDKRKHDIKKADENNMVIRESDNVDLFVRFYKELLEKQSIDIPDLRLKRMKTLIDQLILNNLAKYFVTLDSQGRVTYATIFTICQNKGCYLFGAGDRNLMQRYDGTYCIWEAMKALSSCGVYEIDLEGVNSPDRGWFKLSFGGVLKPYYQVYKKND